MVITTQNSAGQLQYQKILILIRRDQIFQLSFFSSCSSIETIMIVIPSNNLKVGTPNLFFEGTMPIFLQKSLNIHTYLYPPWNLT